MYFLLENQQPCVLARHIGVAGKLPDLNNWNHPYIEAAIPAIRVKCEDGNSFWYMDARTLEPLNVRKVIEGEGEHKRECYYRRFSGEEVPYVEFSWPAGEAWEYPEFGILMPSKFIAGAHKGKMAILISGERKKDEDGNPGEPFWTYDPQREGSSVTLRTVFDHHFSDEERNAVKYGQPVHAFREQD